MRKRTIKIMLGTIAVSGVLGVGVAVAANQPSWAGNGPRATTVANGTRTTDRQHLRARDGTGLGYVRNHDRTRDMQRARDGTGPHHAENSARAGNPDCPYRS